MEFRKTTSQAKPHVLAILPGQLVSAEICIVRPLEKLAKAGKVFFKHVLEPQVTPADIYWADLVVFSRNQDPAFGYFIEVAQARNIPIVYDLDDNFWELPEYVEDRKLIATPERIAQLEEYLRRATLVRAFSPVIAQRVREFNKNVTMVVPGIDLAILPSQKPERTDGKIRITYATGKGAKDELIPIFSEALLSILEKYQDRIEVTFWREIPPDFAGNPAVRLEKYINNYEDYIRILATSGFDIGLAPMLNSKFYRSKTNVKYRDYGACQIPGIYSNVEMYSDCIKNGQTGILVSNTFEDWYSALERLINEPVLRRSIREAAFQDVQKNYSMAHLEESWLDLLDDVTGVRSKLSLVNDLSLWREKNKTSTGDKAVVVNLGAIHEPLVGAINLSSEIHPGFNVIYNSSEPLPFRTGSVDLLIERQLIDKASDATRTLQEIKRVCKNNAQVVALEHISMNELENMPEIAPNVLRKEFFLGLDNVRSYVNGEDQVEFPPFTQGMFHILVSNLPLGKEEIAELKHNLIFFEPPEITNQREQEKNEIIRNKKFQSSRSFPAATEERAFDSKSLTSELAPDDGEGLDEAEDLEKQAKMYRALANRLAVDLNNLRSRKIVRLVGRFFDRTSLWPNIPTVYRQMADDSFLFNASLNGFLLQASEDLGKSPYIRYQVRLNKTYLTGIRIAPVLDVPLESGELGIKIVASSNHQLLHNASIPASQVVDGRPALFSFSPIAIPEKGSLELQIYAHKVGVPIRILEWHRYLLGGAGPVLRKPFFGYLFAAER